MNKFQEYFSNLQSQEEKTLREEREKRIKTLAPFSPLKIGEKILPKVRKQKELPTWAEVREILLSIRPREVMEFSDPKFFMDIGIALDSIKNDLNIPGFTHKFIRQGKKVVQIHVLRSRE